MRLWLWKAGETVVVSGSRREGKTVGFPLQIMTFFLSVAFGLCCTPPHPTLDSFCLSDPGLLMISRSRKKAYFAVKLGDTDARAFSK